MIRSPRLASISTCASRACFALAALSLGVAFAASPANTGPATASPPAVSAPVSPADKAAAEAQYDKANALYQQNKFSEAQIENEKALKLDPANFNALLMRRVLEGRITSLTLPGTAGSQTAPVAAQGKIPLLTSQQVSMVRLMELGPSDRPVGRIDTKVLEDFWQNVIVKDTREVTSKAAHDAFINPANFNAQVRRIRDSRETKFMEQITLTSDPATFNSYRNNVQTFVLASCATADCHSDRGQGGNFRLVNPANSPEQQYTNFYILNKYANPDGKMVDRANPEKSLLLQYALPWANAATKHPKVDVRKFSGLTDARIRTIRDWMNTLDSMAKSDSYLNYYVPGAANVPASAPATTPKK